jgi:hypothetical protein
MLPGWRSVFQVHERHPDGTVSKQTVYPADGTKASWFELRVSLDKAYAGSKTHSIYQVSVPCSCPLGARPVAEEEERKLRKQSGI